MADKNNGYSLCHQLPHLFKHHPDLVIRKGRSGFIHNQQLRILEIALVMATICWIA